MTDTYIFQNDKRLPSVELGVGSEQIQQRRQILAGLNVDLRLQQVCDAVTFQTETKPNWTLTRLITVVSIKSHSSMEPCWQLLYHLQPQAVAMCNQS